MCHLPKLYTLNISGNVQLNLLEIEAVFQNLTELRALSIADITNLPLGLLVPLSNLEILNISGTHLGNETSQMLEPLMKLKVWKNLYCELFAVYGEENLDEFDEKLTKFQ